MSERVSERMSEWIVERASWLFIVIIFPLVSGKMHHTWWTTGRHKNHNCWQQLQFSGLLCVQLRIQTSWIGNTNMPGRRNMERRTSSLYRYEKSGVTVLVGRIKMQIFQRQYNVKWELESTRKAVNATYGALRLSDIGQSDFKVCPSRRPCRHVFLLNLVNIRIVTAGKLGSIQPKITSLNVNLEIWQKNIGLLQLALRNNEEPFKTISPGSCFRRFEKRECVRR